ncbi:hypothetical protein BgiMline_021827 [Biomphalaria glabrata]|nr:hypothetical protein BgiMline_028395 [Biomphalaria glabrata]
MAQWVYYTKKLLSSAVTHLADELEQTVLDFNEAIHNLSSSQLTQERKDSVHIENDNAEGKDTIITEPVQNTLKAPPKSYSKCSSVLPCTGTEDKVDGNQSKIAKTFNAESTKNIFIQSYQVTTTRQPETPGFTSVVTATLSKSSSTLSRGDALKNSLDLQHGCRVHYVNPLPLDNSQSCSSITASPSDNQNIEQKIPTQLCKSPVSEVINRDCVKQNSNLCTLGNNNCKLQSISTKRPGKVIRAQVTSFYDQSTLESHRHFVPIIDGTFEMGSRPNRDNQAGDENRSAVLHTSVNVIVERVSHGLNWLSPLNSISRVLSIALSHVASMLLVIDEESHPLEHDNSPGNRQLSVTYHHSVPASEKFDFTAGHAYQIIREKSSQEPLHSSFMRSTHSCESFEIIEQPSDRDLEHCSEYVGQRPFLLRLFSQSSSNGEIPDTTNIINAHSLQTDPFSSSAEFCNFDFKNLVSNKHFNQLNPFPEKSEDDSLLCNSESPLVIENLKGGMSSPDGSTWDYEEDQEDNESVSFTVISENDDEDFIILQLTS